MRKCCIPCANAKRKCDKQKNECQRCIDRNFECTYPTPKRPRRRLNSTGVSTTVDEASAVTQEHLPLPYSTLMSGRGGVIDENYLNTAATSENTLSTSATCPWFLGFDTWVMKHCDVTPTCSTTLQLEPFISSVEEMLRNWVQNGQNSFVHHRLYSHGMPACIADAFTTLLSYMTCTPAVKDTILQIAEERAVKLVNQPAEALHTTTKTAGPYGGSGAALEIWMQLARVQALFVYEFIRLFDGNIRVRASAELQLPILREWLSHLRETIQNFRGDELTSCATQGNGTQSQFDKDYTAATNQWHLWILAECVRRSHLIIDAVANTYETMHKGWAECSGAVMFTARAGLWEAQTATKWARLSNEKKPLLVASLTPGPLLDEYKSEDIDEFAKMYWTFIVGKDKIEYWVERSVSTVGVF
ncbi:hypothetical protein DM02DRAFT_590015 [Periconia macrospinosa]|uniref:Zn(2)-C6 fungal-type domain-containing protein n=1 Tax=Periconia macrospinosa TaxID=97972 RepID=A0A2V1DVR0_9PLEO|nr:hypothetical protein DM02DRAFT_590015 [Periconia macrospinosa]